MQFNYIFSKKTFKLKNSHDKLAILSKNCIYLQYVQFSKAITV